MLILASKIGGATTFRRTPTNACQILLKFGVHSPGRPADFGGQNLIWPAKPILAAKKLSPMNSTLRGKAVCMPDHGRLVTTALAEG
jgi:hypothetical protein